MYCVLHLCKYNSLFDLYAWTVSYSCDFIIYDYNKRIKFSLTLGINLMLHTDVS